MYIASIICVRRAIDDRIGIVSVQRACVRMCGPDVTRSRAVHFGSVTRKRHTSGRQIREKSGGNVPKEEGETCVKRVPRQA